MMFVLVQAGIAGGKDDIQKYFNDTAIQSEGNNRPGGKACNTQQIITNHVQSVGQSSKLAVDFKRRSRRH